MAKAILIWCQPFSFMKGSLHRCNTVLLLGHVLCEGMFGKQINKVVSLLWRGSPSTRKTGMKTDTPQWASDGLLMGCEEGASSINSLRGLSSLPVPHVYRTYAGCFWISIFNTYLPYAMMKLCWTYLFCFCVFSHPPTTEQRLQVRHNSVRQEFVLLIFVFSFRHCLSQNEQIRRWEDEWMDG